MNKILRRVIALIPAVLIQLLWLYVLLRWLSPYAALINLLLSLFAVLYVLYIITNRNESTYKTLWLLVSPCLARSCISASATSGPAGPSKRSWKADKPCCRRRKEQPPIPYGIWGNIIPA